MLSNQDVGTAIGRLRGERSQLEVARRAGINRSSWSSYENGRRMPKGDTYVRIARGLECSEEELDRAVLHAWEERLDRQRDDRRGDDEPPPALSQGETPGAGVTLSSQEILDLAAHAEQLSDLSRRLLRRHGVPPQR